LSTFASFKRTLEQVDICRGFYRANEFIVLLRFWIVVGVTMRPSSLVALVLRCFDTLFTCVRIDDDDE